jgi:hypothetical protein
LTIFQKTNFYFQNFYRFPKDCERRKIWIQKVRRENWTPKKNTVLCSKHFLDEEFEPRCEHRQRRDLKRTAVPTLFDFPDHLQPKKLKSRRPPLNRELTVEEPTTAPAPVVPKNSGPVISFVKLEHDYSFGDQKDLTKRLHAAAEEVRVTKKENKYLKKCLAAEKRKSKFQLKKNMTLDLALKNMKKKGVLESSSTEHLQSLVNPALQQIFNRIENQKEAPSTEEYPSEIRIFASTLQFYSAKAYEFVRQTFDKALPHASTVRRWFSNIEGTPGFSTLAFNLLEQKVKYAKEKNKPPVIVALMMDDMSIKKHIDYDSKSSSFKGYVDIGTGPMEEDLKPATDALIFMAVGVNWHFKIPLGYFFIAGKQA